MTRVQDIRNFLSMIVFELPSYVFKLNFSQSQWLYITNRNEKYTPAIQGEGLNMLADFTSKLKIAGRFPALSSQLFKKACSQYSFEFKQNAAISLSPQFCFIIGHRGNDKISHLKLVLSSIAAQTDISFECIVVEQSSRPELEGQLPGWVRYYHQKVDESQRYNRSSAFNYGAAKASAEYLILHDNDLVIPACYAQRHLKWLSSGYDLVNLKRYIFGLNKSDSDRLLSSSVLQKTISPEYVLQNAKGGGSLVIKKSAYCKIGGFDNRFSGWGGEDNEFWQRAQILDIYPYGCLPLIHLWHTPQPDKRGGRHGGGRHTEKLIDELSEISIYRRIEDLERIQSC